MKLLIIIAIVWIWLASFIKSYKIQRIYYARRGWAWTLQARNFVLALFIFGPIGLVATWAVYSNDQDEVKW